MKVPIIDMHFDRFLLSLVAVCAFAFGNPIEAKDKVDLEAALLEIAAEIDQVLLNQGTTSQALSDINNTLAQLTIDIGEISGQPSTSDLLDFAERVAEDGGAPRNLAMFLSDAQLREGLVNNLGRSIDVLVELKLQSDSGLPIDGISFNPDFPFGDAELAFQQLVILLQGIGQGGGGSTTTGLFEGAEAYVLYVQLVQLIRNSSGFSSPPVPD